MYIEHFFIKQDFHSRLISLTLTGVNFTRQLNHNHYFPRTQAFNIYIVTPCILFYHVLYQVKFISHVIARKSEYNIKNSPVDESFQCICLSLSLFYFIYVN